MTKLLSNHLSAFIIFIALVLLLSTVGRELNPFSQSMFMGHDETQASRISEFSFNLQNGIFPPRIAPHYSYELSYPLFNFYAPFAYWVTSLVHLLGIPIAASLQISYILAITVAFIGMFLFLKKNFTLYPSLLGAIAYTTSPYIASEIFVRNNLAEMWYIALLPLAFLMLNDVSKKTFLLAVFVLAFFFTSHNILSLAAIPVLVIYIAIIAKNKKLSFAALLSSLLLSSYFFVPAILELHYVNAQEIAKITKYSDHFLCLYQLWYSPWGYAGSTQGCIEDGMSFQIGKLPILFGTAGIVALIYTLIKRKSLKKNYSELFFLIILLGSLFLTSYFSSFIWTFLEPVLSLFQFPWRLLIFVCFGLSFFVAYGAHMFKENTVAKIIIILISLGFLYQNAKFFKGQSISKNAYQKNLISSEYISNKAAYKVAEYLPKTADYTYWRSVENKLDYNQFLHQPIDTASTYTVTRSEPFNKEVEVRSSGTIKLNIHYYPVWQIFVDGDKIIPRNFDRLGRPILEIDAPSRVKIVYSQTLIEKVANSLTVLTLVGLLGFHFSLWKKKTTKT